MSHRSSPVLNGHDASSEGGISSSNQSTVVRMPVRTHRARKLLHGRAGGDSKPAIIGLFGFALRLRSVWDAALEEDPYARWWLVKVEQAYANAIEKIELERAALQADLRAADGFEIKVPDADPICIVELNFACPYAYWAAAVLRSYDELVVAVATAERLGLRRRDVPRIDRFQCERALRGLFCSALGFRALGVTQTDVANNTDLAMDAKSQMGELPTNIVTGERNPTLLAAKRNYPQKEAAR